MARDHMRVLFLVQRPEAWVNIASVWAALEAARGVDTHVLALPYNVEDPALSARKVQQTRKLLQAANVPFEEWHAGLTPEDGGFDAVIINHPYDRERPLAWSFRHMSRAIRATVYIPYGPVMGGGYKDMRLQFAQATQIGASAIVARSAWEKRMYALHCPSGDARIHVLGHPRFDELLQHRNDLPPEGLRRAIGRRLTVLWNSHFSFTPYYSHSSNFSTFDLLGPELFEYAKHHTRQLCLLWRPHPGLFPNIVREGLLSLTEIATLRRELEIAGIVLDESSSHIAAFNASDAILTDVGSFLLEYLATGKPILALQNPDGEAFNEESSALVQHCAYATTPGEVTKFIDMLATHPETLPDPTTALPEHLPFLDGHAGERVAALIGALMMRDPVAVRACNVAHADSVHVEHVLPDPVSHWGTVSPDDMPPTPTLDKLCSELRAMRACKASESQFAKSMRRALNITRTMVGESAKRHPMMIRLARSIRK